MTEKISFDPRIDIRLVADGGCISVVEYSDNGEEEEYETNVGNIIDYLQKPTTKIIESHDDIIVLLIEID